MPYDLNKSIYRLLTEDRLKMLRWSNNNNLDYKKVNPELCFLYQRWQELLEARTLDMYQYNILNSCVACIELQDVVEKTLEGLLLFRQNVDDSKEETLELVKQDFILDAHNKTLQKTLLCVLGSRLGKYKQEDANRQKDDFYLTLKRLKYQLTRPCKTLSDTYPKYIFDELKKTIGDGDKPKIEKCIMALISQCIHNGWSAKGLFELSHIFEGSGDVESKLHKFSESIFPYAKNEYKIYFNINLGTHTNKEHVFEIINELGIVVKRGNDISVNGNSCDPAFSTDKSYAVVDVSANDLNAAVLISLNKLHNKLSVATFYNIISPYVAASPSIIVVDNRHKVIPMKITDVIKTYDYVDSSNDIYEMTKNIIKGDNNEVITRLSAAFAYTNLSRSSYFQETKFITLWIALESIMRSGQYSDIVSNVKRILPAALCARYFYKMARNFIEDCLRCNIKILNVENITINFELPDKVNLVKSLICVFRTEQHYENLLQKCEVNDLLYYRCEELRYIFNDLDKIREKITHFKRKVEWHIQRIYRIRNEITHSAFRDERSLMIYIEHLYSYLSQLISEIVFYVERKGTTSIEAIYASLETNYSVFEELSNNTPPPIIDFLPEGIIDIV